MFDFGGGKTVRNLRAQVDESRALHLKTCQAMDSITADRDRTLDRAVRAELRVKDLERQLDAQAIDIEGLKRREAERVTEIAQQRDAALKDNDLLKADLSDARVKADTLASVERERDGWKDRAIEAETQLNEASAKLQAMLEEFSTALKPDAPAADEVHDAGAAAPAAELAGDAPLPPEATASPTAAPAAGDDAADAEAPQDLQSTFRDAGDAGGSDQHGGDAGGAEADAPSEPVSADQLTIEGARHALLYSIAIGPDPAHVAAQIESNRTITDTEIREFLGLDAAARPEREESRP